MTNGQRRVLVLGPLPPPFHGVATFTRDLLEHGKHPKFQLLHLDTSDKRDAANIGRWDTANVQLGFSNLAQLAAACVRSDIDIIYVPISQSVPGFLRDALFILQARMLMRKVVIHLHGGYFRELYDKPPLPGAMCTSFQALVRLALNSAAAVIVLADEFKAIFQGIVPDKKIVVVENGVPDLLEAAHTTRGAGRTLLYMSTLTRTKGILELVRAVALLRRSRPEIKLKIAGSWNDESARQETLTLIEREQLHDHITFAGNLEGAKKAAFLHSGDVFCLPTRYPYEGQPLALLEAMAAGLPILATSHGAIASTVIDGHCGRIVPKDISPEALADELDRMLSDSAALAAYAARSRARYLEKYTLRACHERLFTVFEGVAES